MHHPELQELVGRPGRQAWLGEVRSGPCVHGRWVPPFLEEDDLLTAIGFEAASELEVDQARLLTHDRQLFADEGIEMARPAGLDPGRDDSNDQPDAPT